MKNNKYFYLFADCIPVKGFTRSVICDMRREGTYFIPNDLYSLLKNYRNATLEEIKEAFAGQEDIIEEYFQYLEKNELGTWVNDINCLPEMDLSWDAPSLITNAIIDIRHKIHDFSEIFPQLIDLGCEDIQIRCFEKLDTIAFVEQLMEQLHESTLKSVELIMKYDEQVSAEQLKALTVKYFRIKSFIMHSAPEDDMFLVYPGKMRNNMGNIIFVKQVIDSDQHCGVINPYYFAYDSLKSFTESQKHNSCLNRKIGIDEHGNIKNCPSLPQKYGHIEENTLEQAVKQAHFKDMWYIHKDQIEVCKDCEFRYICTDCRAFRQDPKNIYAKPAKCSYNPYTATWESPEEKKEAMLENVEVL